MAVGGISTVCLSGTNFMQYSCLQMQTSLPNLETGRDTPVLHHFMAGWQSSNAARCKRALPTDTHRCNSCTAPPFYGHVM